MGRKVAYTGKFVNYYKIMASPLKLGPDTYEFSSVLGIVEEIVIHSFALKI